MVLLSYFSRYGTWHRDVRMDGRMCVCTDSCVTTKIFAIDGLPNFLRYRAPVTHLWHAGGLLIIFN